MTTRAQYIIALREQCAAEARQLRALRAFPSEREERRTIGRYRVFERLVEDLSSITVDMKPARVQAEIENVLDLLAEQKATSIIASIRERRWHGINELGEWTAEGTIVAIDRAVAQLCSRLSTRWNASSPRKHGQYFQVYHSLDLTTLLDIEQGKRYWLGPKRERWYEEVAILRFKNAELPLEQVFQLTNAVDGRWCENREVIWYLKTPRIPQGSQARNRSLRQITQEKQPDHPRSTSVGDIIVALLSGCAWIVDHAGFQMLPVLLPKV